MTWAELGRIIRKDHSLKNISTKDLELLKKDLEQIIRQRKMTT